MRWILTAALAAYCCANIAAAGDTAAGANISSDTSSVNTRTQQESNRTVASVAPYNGRPTIFINGEPHSGMAWATYRPTVERIRGLHARGREPVYF